MDNDGKGCNGQTQSKNNENLFKNINFKQIKFCNFTVRL